MQLHQPLSAVLPHSLRISRPTLFTRNTQGRSARNCKRVLSQSNRNNSHPASTSSWAPFGWELSQKYDSKFAKAGEHTAHYLAAGKGKPVVLMIASQVVMARSYRSTLNALSRDYTVLCLELPGCGRSDSLREPFTHQQYADWIVKFLNHMGISSAIVIGHSCSTAPAIALAELHSNFVSHLILVSAIGGHAPRGLEKVVFGRLHGALLEIQFSIPGAFHGLYNVLFQAQSFWFWIKMTTSLNMLPEAASVQVPTLLCWGRHDYTCPLSAGIKYADVMPMSKLYISEPGSHNWLIQRPEEFLQVVNDFISSADSSVMTNR